MESPPKTPEPASPAQARKRALRFRLILAAIILLLAIATVLLFTNPADEKTAWLTPAQATQATNPGLLTRLRYRLQGLLGPLQRYLPKSKKALIHCDGRIWKLPPAVAAQLNPGAAVLTNHDGARAWVLSAAELASFRARIKAAPGVSQLMAPTMITADGMQCGMQVGNNVLIGGNTVLDGVAINLFPRLSGDSLKLIMSVTATETNSAGPSNSLSLNTNLSVACRITVPNAGAVVIDGGQAGDKNYWFMLSPMLVDARGNPIKH